MAVEDRDISGSEGAVVGCGWNLEQAPVVELGRLNSADRDVVFSIFRTKRGRLG